VTRLRRVELDDAKWDTALAVLGGHPLQSAHWGRARERVDGRAYVAVALASNDRVVSLARAEIRSLPVLGKAAWIPRGPTTAPEVGPDASAEWPHILSALGFSLCVANPWVRAERPASRRDAPRTIWIDLSRGRDALWAGLQKKWRHGVGYASRAGVAVTETREPASVKAFFRLCHAVSETKGFLLPASEPLLLALLEGPTDAPVSSHLFTASSAGRLAAGAFIIRCGASVHYFWGATDRELAGQRPGEALHWAVIEWALARGCVLYDLEGIDPVGNPGTYEFKRKMGGQEVPLASTEVIGLSWLGRLAAPVVAYAMDR